jgi:acylphosphatase
MKAVRLIISGRVQGVYFRAFTKKQAIKNSVFGFVSNKDNGAVEVVAQAEPKDLDSFIEWCHKGSLMAKVDKVEISEYSKTEIFSTFDIH